MKRAKRSMSWVAFFGVFAMPQCALTSAGVSDSPGRVFDVQIDERAWVLADDIRWYSASRSVSVVFVDGPETFPCGKRILDHDANAFSTIFFGDVCDKPTVLVWIRDVGSAEMRRFISHHEAFHAVPQSLGVTSRRAVAGTGLNPVDASVTSSQAIVSFWDALLSQNSDHSGGRYCEVVARRFNELSPGEKIYVDYISHVEWPAEYYAMLVMGWSDISDDYVELRRRLETPRGYLLAYPALSAVEAVRGRMHWQRQYQMGEPMLNTYLTSRSCAPLVVAGDTRRPNRLAPILVPGLVE